jgi:hypothetical protein
MNMRLVWISHTFRKLYDVEFVVNGLAGLEFSATKGWAQGFYP